MFRFVAIATSICIITLAYFHNKLGGLIIGFHNNGATRFSNELVSSGSDDSFGIIIAFGSFIISLVFYAYKGAGTRFVYFINVLFAYFILILINLDISIIGSIAHGDYILVALFLIMHIPAIYHLTSRLRRDC